MTKYEEIRKAAADARGEFSGFRDRCWDTQIKLTQGFVTYCGIPLNRVEFLKWNREKGDARRYRPPEKENERYSIPGATQFDTSDGFWHVGVLIAVTKENEFPQDYVSFVLCVTEKDGSVRVKSNPLGTEFQVNPDNSGSCKPFYDSIVEKIFVYFRAPLQAPKRSIGFGARPNGMHEIAD